MKFDWTINIGTVIAAAGLLSAFVVAHAQNRASIREIQTKVDLLYDWFKRRVIMREE